MTGVGAEDRLRRLGCPFCGYTTGVADRLGAHLERDHPDEVVVDAADAAPSPDDGGGRPDSWRCTECGSVVGLEDLPPDRGRPQACPGCGSRDGDQPTGVDLLVPVDGR